MDKLTIVSLNVRGIRNDFKRRKLFEWLKQKENTIILLQETHSTEDIERQWRSEWGYDCYYSNYNRNSRGVMILLRTNFEGEVVEIRRDQEGRIIILIIKLNNMLFTVANIYAPNNDEPVYFEEMFHMIEDCLDGHMIVGGDFNLVLDVKKDKNGGRHYSHPNAVKIVKKYMDEFELKDIWRHQHPTKSGFTWRRRRPLVQCRLDFFLISFGLVNLIEKCDILPSLNSDHSMITCKIVLNNSERGPGYWKLNTSLLMDTEYKIMVKQTIDTTLEDNKGANPNTMWDIIKTSIRGATINFASNKKRIRSKNKHILEAHITKLEHKLNSQYNETVENTITDLKTKLNQLYDNETKIKIANSKLKWMVEGEKNTKYFLNLEKRNYNNKTISRLQKENGTIIIEKDNILNYQHDYYKALYTCPTNFMDVDDSTKPTNYNNLNIDEKETCDKDITLLELENAVKVMKNDKSPGNDGFPIEFYKIFWNDIKLHFYNAIIYSIKTGMLPLTARQGIISLLPKKEKNTLLLKNWRPLTLLNTDYKILTKSLANRIKPILCRIINNDQTGFLKHRYIGENIRLILDLINNPDKTDGLIISVDFEKAFDSISWKFLYKTLKDFNFGSTFIKYINLINTDISSYIINNGWTSKHFKIERGVRQGCPISPYLFILCAEVLGNRIRDNKNIIGIQVGNQELKISQYADDTNIFLNNDPNSFNNILAELNTFEKESGLTININKSVIAPIGNTRNHLPEFIKHSHIKVEYNILRILGINIPLDVKDTETLMNNITNRIEAIKLQIKNWKKRKLSLKGKVQVVKTLLLPQLTYPLMTLPTPNKNTMKTLDNLIREFVWDNKTPKIKNSILYEKYEDGGLKLTCITAYAKSIKKYWVDKLLDNDFNAKWKTLLYYKLKKLGNDMLFKCNMTISDIQRFSGIKCDFIKELMVVASLYEKDISYTQHIWYNSNIKINNDVLFRKNWYTAGIHKISDVMDDKCSFLSLTSLCTKFNLNPKTEVLYYNGLKSLLNCKLGTTKLPLKINNSKVYYTILKEIIPKQTNSSMVYWDTYYNINLIEWGKIYEYCHINIFDTYTQSFLYKFAHRIIQTNSKLCIMNVIDNASCNFCSHTNDSLEHIYYECQITKIFYKQIHNLMKLFNMNVNILSINKQYILLQSLKYQSLILNFIITASKIVIHKSYWYGGKPSIQLFKTTLYWQCKAAQKAASAHTKKGVHLPEMLFSDVLPHLQD